MSGGGTLYRLNANGSTDTSFGGGGTISTLSGVNALEVQADGKIVVAGFTTVKNKTLATVSRHNANGSVDQSFGSGGKVISDSIGAKDIAIAVNGDIYVAGTIGSTTLSQNATVARLLPSGQFDVTFGSGGIAVFDSGVGDVAAKIGLQPDGKVLVTGNTISGLSPTADLLTARLDSAGNIDYSFGSLGGAVTDIFGNADTSRGVFVQNLGSEDFPDRRILVTGSAWSSDPTQQYAVIVRYLY
jgi:uncharacterized delta-60 repeat protein